MTGSDPERPALRAATFDIGAAKGYMAVPTLSSLASRTGPSSASGLTQTYTNA
jgi:hypothetical protein